MSDVTTSILWQKGWRINSRNEWYKPPAAAVSAIPNPVQEPDIRHEPPGTDAGKEAGTGSHIRMAITSYRVRLADIDNLEIKWIVDALRYGKLIPGDSPEHITELSIRQVKVHHYIDEYTEIEIL
jgi:hypothetical protein